MKVVILAGGYGTRISEESITRPKPMIEIGGRPILWHIMKIFSQQGINDFVICLGYKGYFVKEYFANYLVHLSDVTFDFTTGDMALHRGRAEPWKVTLIDTGESTMTGGRLKRVAHALGSDTFMLTYGDGVADIDIKALVNHHRAVGCKATVTAVRPPGRFGALELKDGVVDRFVEKPAGDGGWINGGFFVLEPSVLDYIDGDETVWEREPLERLSAEGELAAYRHGGFWQPMDTLRDKTHLEQLLATGKAPWKTW
ncbi:MAG: glucose-1-phosphate cytidylyltransferase [Pseudomonadota bacterium]